MTRNGPRGPTHALKGSREVAVHGHDFSTACNDVDDPHIDLSPWAPLLAVLDATEPETSPGDRPFTPGEGVEGAHALELRAESMRHYAERGALRTGELDRTEVGDSDDNRDVVAGRAEVEVDGMLEEHTGDDFVNVADEVEINVEGPLTMHADLEDNIIMGGVMRDEFAGGTVVTAAMSDDLAAGARIRCTAPLDVWLHGLVGMEERPGTCAADGLLLELAGTLYEREYGPSAHAAAVARFQDTTVSTMKTGFRPLMKTALGVRNLIPGGGGGGGQASTSAPAAPPPIPPGGEVGAATLTAVQSGSAFGYGVAGGGDTDAIVSAVRTSLSASDITEVEDLHHCASTADNVDSLARVEVDGAGYRQVADIYNQPVPTYAVSEPDFDELVDLAPLDGSLHELQDAAATGAHRVADPDTGGVVGVSTQGDDIRLYHADESRVVVMPEDDYRSFVEGDSSRISVVDADGRALDPESVTVFLEPVDDSNLHDTSPHLRSRPAASGDAVDSVRSPLATFNGSRVGDSSLVEPQPRLEHTPGTAAWSGGEDEIAHHGAHGDVDSYGAPTPGIDPPSPVPSGRPLADSTPVSNPARPGAVFTTPKPTPLDLTEPGTARYDLGRSYGLLRARQQHYRDHAIWRGNLALTEALGAIDKRAIELFTGLDGSLNDIMADGSTRTASIRDALEAMAEQARTSGRSGRAKAICEAISELDQLVHGTAVAMAAQADEFSGAALGAQRVRIDPHIDTDLLRRWLHEQWVRADDQLAQASELAVSTEEMHAAQRAGWEKLYYDQMLQSLDKGVSPLATSSEMIAYVRSNASKAQFELLLKLEAGLVATLSDPAFIRSISEMAEMGADTFPPMVRARIDAGLDFLGPDSLRLADDDAIPPPLPAANLSDLASHVGEVRDRNFSRSSLAASEETLERHVLNVAETDSAPRRAAPSAGTGYDGVGTPKHASGIYRTPRDNAQAPIIDEPSGVWVIEALAESDPSLAHRDGASLPAQGNGASSQIPPVSWDSGLRETWEVDRAGGDVNDSGSYDIFNTAF